MVSPVNHGEVKAVYLGRKAKYYNNNKEELQTIIETPLHEREVRTLIFPMRGYFTPSQGLLSVGTHGCYWIGSYRVMSFITVNTHYNTQEYRITHNGAASNWSNHGFQVRLCR